MAKETHPEIHKFGHLHVVLFRAGKPGAAWAAYANYDEKGLTRNAPLFSGVIEPETGAQLHKIADAIDAIMREKLMGAE